MIGDWQCDCCAAGGQQGQLYERTVRPLCSWVYIYVLLKYFLKGTYADIPQMLCGPEFLWYPSFSWWKGCLWTVASGMRWLISHDVAIKLLKIVLVFDKQRYLTIFNLSIRNVHMYVVCYFLNVCTQVCYYCLNQRRTNFSYQLSVINA